MSYETSKDYREEIASDCKHYFKDHVLTREGGPVWRCHREGDFAWMNAFRIAFLPGAIVLWGDAEVEIMIRPHVADGIRWALTCPNLGYFLSKVVPGHRGEHWCPGDALAEVADLRKNAEDYGLTEDQIETLDDAAKADYNQPHEWLDAYCGEGLDDPSDHCDASRRAIVAYHAMRKFAELYRAREEG